MKNRHSALHAVRKNKNRVKKFEKEYLIEIVQRGVLQNKPMIGRLGKSCWGGVWP